MLNEKILIVGEISTESTEKKSEEKRKQSFVGALLPLVIPLFILIHIYIENIEFSNLDSTLKFFFWASIIFSCVMFFLHSKFVNIENDKNESALENAEKQSIIVSNKRIYGNNNGAFSFDYSDLENVYSSKTAGNSAELVIRTTRGDLLKFQHIKNFSSIIAIASEEIEKNKSKQTSPNETINNFCDMGNDNLTAPADEKTEQSLQSQKNDLFNVVITSASGSLEQIKIIRRITLLDFKRAKELFLKLPYVLAESQTFDEAYTLKKQLSDCGIEVKLDKVGKTGDGSMS